MASSIMKIHGECKGIDGIALALTRLAGAFEATGNEKVSDALRDYAYVLEQGTERIRDVVTEVIDERVREARGMTTALLDTALAVAARAAPPARCAVADPKMSPLDRVRRAVERNTTYCCNPGKACAECVADRRALDETAARLARLEAVADAARAFGALRQRVLDAMTQGLDDDAEALAFQLTEAGDALDARVRALDAPTGDAAPAPRGRSDG